MKYTVELDDHAIDDLVRQRLMEDYNAANYLSLCNNQETLNALDFVIKYYSSPSEYKEWKKSPQEKD